MGRLLTVRQVAAKLQVCEKTVRRAIREGRLQARRLGHGARRSVRVPEEALEGWAVEQGKVREAAAGEGEEAGARSQHIGDAVLGVREGR